MNFYVLGTNGVLARIRKNNRQELAKGDIVNFKVVTRINGVNDKDTLFYLDRVKTEEGRVHPPAERRHAVAPKPGKTRDL